MERVVVEEAERYGVSVGHGSSVRIVEHSEIRNNGEAGIIQGDSSSLTVLDSKVEGNGQYGIFVSNGSHAFLRDNLIDGTGIDGNRIGVLVFSNSSATMENNTITNNSGNGLVILTHGFVGGGSNTFGATCFRM